MKIAMLVLGVVMALLGVLWFLQGIGVLGGSVMSGQTTWAVVGPIVAIVGIGLAVASRRRPAGRR
ncbi:hypothetical protein [Kineococcus rubinsiae]|uniref:hypothetical protein n=1 Tax=Kineococcus rubinsiae TaxID=2609562 RepID=UPI00142FDB87|nr:hypothetical protein [Kineococcus rubinsiae]NIZ90591.1 hypothetical protein [Kineococcus rubinsiae]